MPGGSTLLRLDAESGSLLPNVSPTPPAVYPQKIPKSLCYLDSPKTLRAVTP